MATKARSGVAHTCNPETQKAVARDHQLGLPRQFQARLGYI